MKTIALILAIGFSGMAHAGSISEQSNVRYGHRTHVSYHRVTRPNQVAVLTVTENLRGRSIPESTETAEHKRAREFRTSLFTPNAWQFSFIEHILGDYYSYGNPYR